MRYYVKYHSKIFNYGYEDLIEAASIDEAISKFRKVHADTVTVKEVVMAEDCNPLSFQNERQIGINTPWVGERE